MLISRLWEGVLALQTTMANQLPLNTPDKHPMLEQWQILGPFQVSTRGMIRNLYLLDGLILIVLQKHHGAQIRLNIMAAFAISSMTRMQLSGAPSPSMAQLAGRIAQPKSPTLMRVMLWSS